jgi:GNAT superfamily N-acetyltransferase
MTFGRKAAAMTQRLVIRDYSPEDGEVCHELRRAAFLGVFSKTLPQDAVRAGAESYGVSEFVDRISAMETFVASVGGVVVAFCSMRPLTTTRAELLYLYVSPHHQGTGIGSRLARYVERHVTSSHPELETLFLDTAVPEYNQAFWEHMGYQSAGTSVCDYPTGQIPAVRLEKRVGGRRAR